MTDSMRLPMLRKIIGDILSEKEKVDPRLGKGLLNPLIYAHQPNNVNADGTPHDDGDDGEETHSEPNIQFAPTTTGDYGIFDSRIPSLMELLLDGIEKKPGEAWGINTTKWAAKNRNGIRRQFTTKTASQNFAQNDKRQDSKTKGITLGNKGITNPTTGNRGIKKTTYGNSIDADDTAEESLKERNYKQEYARYHKNPKQKKRRAQRNKSRRKMERAGKVHKNDGNDVDHISRDTSDSSSKNLRVQSKSVNRSRNQ